MGLPYAHFSVSTDEDNLYLQIKPDKGWYELIPQSETSFFHLSMHDDFQVTFIPDESRQAVQFLYEVGGQTYTFTRMDTMPPLIITSVAPTPTPTEQATATVAPTSTPAAPTATFPAPTATPPQPTIAPAEPTPEPHPGQIEESARRTWWLVPVLALIALAVWYGVRRWLSVR
jgi:hypothetical protein